MSAAERRLRVVFFGTSAFAVPALRAIASAHDVVAVLTQPPRPAGRGKRLTPSAVGAAAAELGLPVATPERPIAELERLRGLAPDVVVVASYGRILPQALLDLAPRGALNIHPSRLPLYRGADPIAGPVRDGRVETAVSVMRMDAGLDTGDVVRQTPTAIGATETGTELHDRLAALAAEEILAALADAVAGRLRPRPQAQMPDADQAEATFTRPYAAEALLIDWSRSAARVADFVRAYAATPAARAVFGDERVKVLRAVACPEPSTAPPGTPLGVRGEGLLVACGEGVVSLETVVPPGRAAQRGAEYGRRLGVAA